MSENKINIGGRLHSIATGNVVAGADEILDDIQNKKQNLINQETSQKIGALEEAVGTGGSIDARIEAAVGVETQRATEAENARYTKEETYSKEQLDNLITTPNQKYVTVEDYASLPESGEADTTYRVANWDGSLETPAVDITKYSEYAWDGTKYVFLSVKSQIGEVYDISAANGNETYDDLNDALTSNTGGVPSSLRKGGMSVKFIQTSDNKYVRYNYQISSVDSDDFTNVANWIGVDDVLENVSEISKTDASDDDNFVAIEDEEGNTVVEITPDGVDAKNLKSNGVDVLTESDKDGLATKEDIEILDMMSEEETSDDTEEQSWQSDNGQETFAAIGTYGIKAKAYYDINGNPIPTEPISFDTASITIPTDLTQYKSTIVGLRSDACKDNDMNNVFGTQDLGRHCQESAWINAHGEVSFLSTWNCAFGYHSMFQTYNGNYNVGFGNETLDNLTVGDWNTAIGTNALQMRGNSNKECTSYQSTAVGANSQRYTYNRRGNTSLGFETLSGVGTDSTTAPSVSCHDYNIAIGHKAGKFATSDLELYIGSCTSSNSYSNNAEEKACTLMYGKSDGNKNIANQFLKVNGMFAANGATPQSPLTAEADATDLSSALTLLNQIKDALIKSGIMKASNV